MDEQRGRRLGLLGVALVTAVAFSYGAGENERSESRSPAPNLEPLRASVGLKPCPSGISPSFQSEPLRCLDGSGDVPVAAPPGQPLVVNAWAWRCVPCREEMPYLVDLAGRAGTSLRVVGAASDADERTGLEFLGDFRVTFPNVLDADGTIFRSVGVGLPQTIFIRPDGSIVHVKGGPIRSQEELDALVRQHLEVELAAAAPSSG